MLKALCFLPSLAFFFLFLTQHKCTSKTSVVTSACLWTVPALRHKIDLCGWCLNNNGDHLRPYSWTCPYNDNASNCPNNYFTNPHWPLTLTWKLECKRHTVFPHSPVALSLLTPCIELCPHLWSSQPMTRRCVHPVPCVREEE